jgi:hypothetical protein
LGFDCGCVLVEPGSGLLGLVVLSGVVVVESGTVVLGSGLSV